MPLLLGKTGRTAIQQMTPTSFSVIPANGSGRYPGTDVVEAPYCRSVWSVPAEVDRSTERSTQAITGGGAGLAQDQVPGIFRPGPAETTDHLPSTGTGDNPARTGR